jgi:hypothetical protein
VDTLKEPGKLAGIVEVVPLAIVDQDMLNGIMTEDLKGTMDYLHQLQIHLLLL